MSPWTLYCLVSALVADNYRIKFSIHGHNVTQGRVGDIVDVTLYSTDPQGTLTYQDLEIKNFNEDMSDIEFQNATFVDGSLTNRVDSSDVAPFENGFLKAFEIRDGQRVSLSSEIRFRMLLTAVGDATLKCRSQRFMIYDPDLGQRSGNEEKDFEFKVLPMSITCGQAKRAFRSTCCGLDESVMETTYAPVPSGTTQAQAALQIPSDPS